MTVWLGDFWSTYSALIFTVGVNGLLALSIWLTLACGLLSLANAAFMGIGAYVAALLTLKLGWPFAAALVINEPGFRSDQHNVSGLKIPIHEIIASCSEQKIYHGFKIIFQFLFIKRNFCKFEEVVFEIVQIPHH